MGGVFHGPHKSVRPTLQPTSRRARSLAACPSRTRYAVATPAAGKQRENANLDGARNFLMAIHPAPRSAPLFMRREARECGNGCGNFATKCNFSVSRVSSFENLCSYRLTNSAYRVSDVDRKAGDFSYKNARKFGRTRLGVFEKIDFQNCKIE